MSDSRSRDVRQRIEDQFELWGSFAYRHPRPILLAALLVSVALISQIPRLTIDNSTDSFLHPDDPIRLMYDEFRFEFGRDERVIVAIEAPDVFAPEFLARLREFHRELESQVPHVDSMISMINARNTRGEGDELIVEELLETWPETAADLEGLRARVMANPLYENTLISPDARITTVSIQLYAFANQTEGLDALAGFDDDPDADTNGASTSPYLPEEKSSEAVKTVREVMQRYDGPGFRTYMAGGPVITERLNDAMQTDVQRFVLISMIAIGVLLYLLFRRLAAVFLPLLVVVLSMLCTLGIMAAIGMPMSVVTQILPSFLLAVGVCDAVHILAIFFRRLDASHDEEEAIRFTLGHSGLAIVMTSLTTAGGLASFSAAALAPVANLGIVAPIGVMFALVYTLVLLPPLLAVVPIKRRALHAAGQDRIDRELTRLGAFAAARPRGIVAFAAVVLVVSAWGITSLRFSHDPMQWFPDRESLKVGTLMMNDRLDGINVVELLVGTGAENGVHEPALLDRLEEIHAYAATIEQDDWHISKTISIVDVLKEVNQALNENRSDFYRIPRSRPLVAQELLLFENSGSDDLEDFVDPLFQTARVTLRVPWVDTIAYPPLLERIQGELADILGEDVELRITGLVAVLSQTFSAMIHSLTRSYLIALLVITPLMILLIGHLRRGLLSMIPNLTPVIMTLGFMGFADIPIDGATLLIGAVVIGLAVDDTIHFMHNFRRYYEQTGDAPEAIRRTLTTTGRALMVTSLVLSAGFFTFTGAYMTNMFNFGLLSGGAIVAAFFSNVLLSSALMVLDTRREQARAARALAPGAESGSGAPA